MQEVGVVAVLPELPRRTASGVGSWMDSWMWQLDVAVGCGSWMDSWMDSWMWQLDVAVGCGSWMDSWMDSWMWQLDGQLDGQLDVAVGCGSWMWQLDVAVEWTIRVGPHDGMTVRGCSYCSIQIGAQTRATPQGSTCRCARCHAPQLHHCLLSFAWCSYVLKYAPYVVLDATHVNVSLAPWRRGCWIRHGAAGPAPQGVGRHPHICAQRGPPQPAALCREGAGRRHAAPQR
jgi:hypothetical protein